MHFRIRHFVVLRLLIVKNVWTKRFVGILTNSILGTAIRHSRWQRHRYVTDDWKRHRSRVLFRVKSYETSRNQLFFGLRHIRFCLLTGALHADCWRWHRLHRCKMQIYIKYCLLHTKIICVFGIPIYIILVFRSHGDECEYANSLRTNSFAL